MSHINTRPLVDVSEDLLMMHTREIAKWIRLSGSEDEAKSLEYVKKTLNEYGYDVREYHFESFVGYPEAGEVTVLGAGGKKFTGSVPALSTSSRPRGITARLLYVGKGDNYKKIDVKGKVALIDGLSNPRLAKLAEDHGAVGQIFVNDDHVHEGIISVIWGTPTPETAPLLHKTPCMNITASEGEYLVRLLKKRPVKVKLKTKAWRGWKKIPVVTAELKGKEGDFVLFSGHIDSWYHGAMDNGTANATMLEVARVMASHRELLRRGLRLAFWSGHSHGRYAGSAWYADNFWEDLYEHCVAHVNVDSVGGKGATILSEGYVMSETKNFVSSIVEKVSGQKLVGRRFSRAGDQSFWGLGIPAMLMSLSEQPPSGSKTASFVFSPHSGGLGWWWHTREDTVDKIDPAFLVRDAKIYTLIISELCSSPLLPFDYSATVSEMEQRLTELQTQSRNLFDLTPLIKRAESLKELTAKLNSQTEVLRKGVELWTSTDSAIASANETIKLLGRLLVPINYSKVGPFDQDLAIPIPSIPILDPIKQLPQLKATSDEYRFLQTRLRRESNKVSYAFLQAEKSITRLLKELGA